MEKKTLCILLEINVLAEWTYILLQTQTDTQEEINPQHRVLLDPIHSCGSHLPPLLPFPLPTFPTTPWKHPNHPASTGMWTLCLVHLLLSLSFSLTPSLPLSLSPLPPLFSSVCFHSPSFRVITWHLHCKVPNAALSSSAGDWASFPQQIRERKRKRERKRGLRQGVMLFWIAGYRNNAPNSLLFSLSGSERTQIFFFKFPHINNHSHYYRITWSGCICSKTAFWLLQTCNSEWLFLD